MDRKQFEKWVHKFGMSTSAILAVLMIAFPVSVSVIYGVWPNFGQIWPATLTVILFLAPWWPGETIGYMTTMGPGALYMSYITGNVTNLRMPATVGTINALEMEPNTDECHTMAIIACGASNFTTIIILVFGVLLSIPLQPILTAPVLQPAFNFAIPALFGGLTAQSIFKNKKNMIYSIPCIICSALFCYFTTISAAYYMLVTIVLGVVIFVVDYKAERKKAAEKAE